MGIILARQTKTTKAAIAYLLGVCALAGFLGFFSTVLLDRAMYGVWAIPVFGNFHFNVIQGNGSLYGTHPFHWYFTAGVPALTGILFPVLIYDLLFARWNRASRNIWTVIAFYVIAHSASAHKEFRFLLPILPIISLLWYEIAIPHDWSWTVAKESNIICIRRSESNCHSLSRTRSSTSTNRREPSYTENSSCS